MPGAVALALRQRAAMALGALALAFAAAAPARAASLAASHPLCDRAQPMSAARQDRLLRFAGAVRAELEASGQRVALVSRSGLALERFRIRYSHAGIALAASREAPWSVRQLYFACEEGAPRLYDQGLAGFLSNPDDPDLGHVALVLLPPAPAAALERAAADDALALGLVAPRYSANAYAYSTLYQNCNQWLAELIAQAWGARSDEVGAASAGVLRARSQAWLRAAGYLPSAVDLGSHWVLFAGGFVPWIHLDDHPEDDRYALSLRISLPTAIEAFVHAREPAAQRIELCHDTRRIVVRHGWRPFGEGCVAEDGDRVIELS